MGFFRKIAALLLVSVLLVFTQNCSVSNTSTSGGQAPSNQSTALNSGTYVVGPNAYPFTLLKLMNATGEPTYVQWFAPQGQGQKPAVLIVEPYAGIDWSGDATDEAWAARPNANVGYAYPDVNGPNFQNGVAANINYRLLQPQDAGPQALPFLKSGMGVLIVYGRFYAGGDIASSVRSVQTGLVFLATQASVDKQRVGVWGISFGGFEAVYGAATAPAGITPAFGVSWMAPLDMRALANYFHVDLPTRMGASALNAATAFFEPYSRRIFAMTGGWPQDANSDYSRYEPTNSLIPKLRTRLLVLHDDWDMIVPASIGRNFVSAAGGLAEGFWFPHSTTMNYDSFVLDHTQPSEGLVSSVGYLYTWAYLLNRLGNADSSFLLLQHSSDNSKQYTYLRNQQLAGKDISSLVPRFLDLCDSRIQIFDLSGGPQVSGPQYLTSILQTYWGGSAGSLNAGNVCTYLRTNGLPN